MERYLNGCVAGPAGCKEDGESFPDGTTDTWVDHAPGCLYESSASAPLSDTPSVEGDA